MFSAFSMQDYNRDDNRKPTADHGSKYSTTSSDYSDNRYQTASQDDKKPNYPETPNQNETSMQDYNRDDNRKPTADHGSKYSTTSDYSDKNSTYPTDDRKPSYTEIPARDYNRDNDKEKPTYSASNPDPSKKCDKDNFSHDVIFSRHFVVSKFKSNFRDAKKTCEDCFKMRIADITNAHAIGGTQIFGGNSFWIGSYDGGDLVDNFKFLHHAIAAFATGDDLERFICSEHTAEVSFPVQDKIFYPDNSTDNSTNSSDSPSSTAYPKSDTHVPSPNAYPTDLPMMTDMPTTTSPSTDSPSTDSPSTDSPSTDSPSTDSPSTDSPSTDSPSTDSPSTDSPMTDSPTNFTYPTVTVVQSRKRSISDE